MFVNAVLGHELRSVYPNNGYVSKCFEVKKLWPKAGKRYHTFEIHEVEVIGKGLETLSEQADGSNGDADPLILSSASAEGYSGGPSH